MCLPRVPKEFRVPLAHLVRKAKEEPVVSLVLQVAVDLLVNVYVPTLPLQIIENISKYLNSGLDHNNYTPLCAGCSWCSWFPWC